MYQLGSIMAELSNHRFDEIGSLFNDENGQHIIGECLSPSLTWQERDSLDLDRGPFHQEQEYLVSLISAFTSHAQELLLTPHVFYAPVPHELHYKTMESYRAAAQRWNDFVSVGQKICHSKNVLCYCIAGQFLLEMIPQLSSAGLDSGFTLSHPDLHVGNIYVDGDFNITCIIDWSSTSTGPISELLATPALGGPAKPPSEYLTAAFRSGFSQQASKVAPRLSPKLWEISDYTWHFSRLVRLLSRNDYEHFRQLFELVNGPSTEGAGILRLFHERAGTDENRKLLVELQEEDLTAEELQEKERPFFPAARNANSDALAVARKLTLMSDMNPTFLADHVLWRWVEEALKRDCPM